MGADWECGTNRPGAVLFLRTSICHRCCALQHQLLKSCWLLTLCCAGCQDSSSSEAGAELDGWILSNLAHHKLRRARVAALTKAAQPFQYDKAEVMLVIGTKMSTSVK